MCASALSLHIFRCCHKWFFLFTDESVIQPVRIKRGGKNKLSSSEEEDDDNIILSPKTRRSILGIRPKSISLGSEGSGSDTDLLEESSDERDECENSTKYVKDKR